MALNHLCEFSRLLHECEAAHNKLKNSNFVSETGLRLRIAKAQMPELLRKTQGAQGLELYLVQQNAHHCLQTLGRLRERAFRSVGGGTHRELDLDHWDYSGFWQLLCIDTAEHEICGAYRLLHSAQLCAQQNGPNRANGRANGDANSDEAGKAELGSVHSLFDFSPFMQTEILPRSIELGRSFVNEEARRAHLALPLMFEGLGQIIAQNVDFVIGKITFYPETLDSQTLWLLDSFLNFYWGEATNPLRWKQRPQTKLARPKTELDFRKHFPKEAETLREDLQKVLPPRFERGSLQKLLEFLETQQGGRQNPKSTRAQTTQMATPKATQKDKKRAVLRGLALFLKYVSLLNEPKNGMHVFGGAVNPHFGNVIEFMSFVEVAEFHNDYLQRWGGGANSDASACPIDFFSR